LGEFIAAHFPQAAAISLDSPHFCDFAAGYQWYSIQGATDDSRHSLVAEQMPRFVQMVQHWQQHFGVAPEATCLVGFSQGAFMSLQSTQQSVFLAGRVVALAGRFTAAPSKPAHPVVIHLLHGDQDTVVPHSHSVAAGERLAALGADVTTDLLPGLAHGISNEMAQAIIARLTSYVPKRIWDEAMGAAG
jgi:phospholipase/carboxylesterase